MRFVHPELLWCLLALPLLAVLAWGVSRTREKAVRAFAGGHEYVARFTGQVSSQRRIAKALLLGIALGALIVAAARPQWGTRLEPVTQKGIDLMVVLDTSLSMAAEDMAPSRLGQAKHEVDTLLEGIEGNRVGLVTFAGQPSLVSPLTVDHAAVRLFLDAVDVESVQVPGTALAEALALAVQAFRAEDDPGEERGRAIVLFSDGEDHEGGVEEVIGDLRRVGVSIFAVGCGTTRGAPIPLEDESGRPTGAYKKDREDRVVTTRLAEGVLEQLALETDGRYYRATPSEVEVGEIAKALTGLDAHEYGAVLRARYEERFQIPLAVALIALVCETLLGAARKSQAQAQQHSEAA